MADIQIGGVGFRPDAIAIQVAKFCTNHSITTKAQLRTVVSGLTQAQVVNLLSQLFLEAIVFNGEDLTTLPNVP